MDTPERLFDVRILKRNLTAGLVKKTELKERLDALPDDAERSVTADTRFIRRGEDRR